MVVSILVAVVPEPVPKGVVLLMVDVGGTVTFVGIVFVVVFVGAVVVVVIKVVVYPHSSVSFTFASLTS